VKRGPGRPRIVDEFADLPVSRQRKHQLRRAKRGLCQNKGCQSPPAPGCVFCDRCSKESNDARRVAIGCGEWVPGMRGRPPKHEAARVAAALKALEKTVDAGRAPGV